MFPWRWIITRNNIAHARPRLDRAGGTPRHLAHRGEIHGAADPDPALPDLRGVAKESEPAISSSLFFYAAL